MDSEWKEPDVRIFANIALWTPKVACPGYCCPLQLPSTTAEAPQRLSGVGGSRRKLVTQKSGAVKEVKGMSIL